MRIPRLLLTKLQTQFTFTHAVLPEPKQRPVVEHRLTDTRGKVIGASARMNGGGGLGEAARPLSPLSGHWRAVRGRRPSTPREKRERENTCLRGGGRGAEIGHVVERPSRDKVGLVNRQVVVVTGASHLLLVTVSVRGGGVDRPPRVMQERDRCFTRLGPRVLGAALDASFLVWMGFLLCNRFLLGWRRRGKRSCSKVLPHTQILC